MKASATYRRPEADKAHRVIVLMTPAELAALDEWGVTSRMASRAEAVRRLIEQGLRASNSGARNDDADEGLPGKPALSASQATAAKGPSKYET